jgi:hypothetical protein
MSRVVFTDFSGIEKLNSEMLQTRTIFSIHTPACLEGPDFDLPEWGMVLDGSPVQFHLKLSQQPSGWDGSIDVLFSSLEPADSAGEFLVNLMLDVASLKFATPFQFVRQADSFLSASGNWVSSGSAVILPEDLVQSWKIAFLFSPLEPILLRSIGWYRRGISSADPMLSFLGLWNSLEIAASTFCEKNEKTKRGIRNQLFQLMHDHLRKVGIQFFKPDTTEMDEWIDQNYKIRLDIAHGLGSTDIQTSRRISNAIPKLRRIATGLLRILCDDRLKNNERIVDVLNRADSLAAERRQEK